MIKLSLTAHQRQDLMSAIALSFYQGKIASFERK